MSCLVRLAQDKRLARDFLDLIVIAERSKEPSPAASGITSPTEKANRAPAPRYTVRIKPSAEKEMDRMPASVFDRLAAAILESKPTPGLMAP